METEVEKVRAFVSLKRKLRGELMAKGYNSLLPLTTTMTQPQVETMLQIVTPNAATPAMHPAQSWRDGYSDGASGKPYGHTHQYHGDSALLYSDGYAVGSVKRHSH